MTILALAPMLCALALNVDATHFAASAAPTRFTAANTSTHTQLLLLGDATLGARAQMLIAPGANFETYFPSGTLDGLFIEIVSFTPEGRKASGAVSFDKLLVSGIDSLSIEITAGVSTPWLNTATGRIPGDSGIDLAPASLMSDAAPWTQPLIANPVHVPVITPDDISTHNVAPVIRSTDPSI
jgi:hypothetical protein